MPVSPSERNRSPAEAARSQLRAIPVCLHTAGGLRKRCCTQWCQHPGRRGFGQDRYDVGAGSLIRKQSDQEAGEVCLHRHKMRVLGGKVRAGGRGVDIAVNRRDGWGVNSRLQAVLTHDFDQQAQSCGASRGARFLTQGLKGGGPEEHPPPPSHWLEVRPHTRCANPAPLDASVIVRIIVSRLCRGSKSTRDLAKKRAP